MSRFAVWTILLLGLATFLSQSEQVLGQDDNGDDEADNDVDNDLGEDDADEQSEEREKRQFRPSFCDTCLAQQRRGLRVGCIGCGSFNNNNNRRDSYACQSCLAQQRRGLYIRCQPACGS
ncbi:uncharacterized protein LOC110853018 isoform X2 [Folsomia candida]|uniref:uncharacterized protein LOC110853018 isoform X2 n=1 Tax=Folsomia candida TaxID=158441 RepID=UPI000B902C0C|nr:uncharacterized protein LOC110853018 isoform X2 [Folsomia candida]